MIEKNYTTSIRVDRTPHEVFYAINNVRGWWSEEIEGVTDKLNEVWKYRYEDVHSLTMQVIELVPGKRVAWRVLDNYFSFVKDNSEWVANSILFELSETENGTLLQFTHDGLVPSYECYDICQNAWTTYIHKSLYNLINTGKGQPNAKGKPQTEDEKRLASDYTVAILVDQSPSEVFVAVNNVRGWWQGEIDGSSTKLNDEFSYRMKDIHYSRQKLVEVIPDQKVVWSVTESSLNFISDKHEWTGTRIVFEISEINNKTKLRFTHVGLVPDVECYEGCSFAWGRLIQESLFNLITTGKGTKVF
jgi:hypothetical protein